MDTNEEERESGKTVDIGKAYFETTKKRCTIIDAPGHKNYVPNMIAGASQADICILVISARKGEFEAGFERHGQTREHIILAKTLGIQKVIVVINKMGDPTVEWSEDRYNECTKKLSPFIRSCGFNIKKDVTFIPIDALTGINIKNNITDCNYSDKSIIETLDDITITGRDHNKPLRIIINGSYQDRGTVIMGKIESGVLSIGQDVMLCPGHIYSKVESIIINSKEVLIANAGENVLVRTTIPEESVKKGDVMCSNTVCSSILTGCTEVIAQVMVINQLEHRPLVSSGYKAVFHSHLAMEECNIYEIVAETDPKNSDRIIKKNPNWIKLGSSAIIKIKITNPICIESYKENNILGRLVIRDEGKTIMIGKIIKCR
jgi:peptide chain release factor subunit 3